MTVSQIFTYLVIPVGAAVGILLAAFFGYRSEKESAEEAVVARRNSNNLQATLDSVKADAERNLQELKRKLDESEQKNLGQTNELADLVVARDSAREELKRERLVKQALATGSGGAARQMPAAADEKEDAEILRQFARYPSIIKARLDDNRRIQAGETAALERALQLNETYRPKVQAVVDTVLRAVRRSEEAKQLPVTEFRGNASLPARIFFTQFEEKKQVPTNFGLISAMLPLGESVQIQVWGGFVKSPDQLFGNPISGSPADLVSYPFVLLQYVIPDNATRQVQRREFSFSNSTGELDLGAVSSEIAALKSNDERIFALSLESLVTFRAEAATVR